MKKALYTFLAGLLAPVFLSAQFLIRYTDPSGGNCSFNTILDYGNGHALAIGNLNNKLIFVEVDGLGNVVKSRLVTVEDETKTPVCFDALIDDEGMIAVAGTRATIGNVATYNGFVARYDFENNLILWERSWKDIAAPYGSYYVGIIQLSGGDYQVGGSYSEASRAQEGIIVTFKKENGKPTVNTLLNWGDSADDFASFTRVNKKIYTLGRYNFAGDFGKMRPAISILDQDAVEISSHYYIREYSPSARLYGADITDIGNKLYAVAHGDNDGISLNQDLYFMKFNKDGIALQTRRLDMTGTSDGRFQAITTLDGDLLAHGNKYSSTAPFNTGNAFLMRLNDNGSVEWANSYPFTACNTGGSQSSLIATEDNGVSYAWAVGRVLNTTTGLYEGSILKVNTGNGVLGTCSFAESVTSISETNISEPISMTAHVPDNIMKLKTAVGVLANASGVSTCVNGIDKFSDQTTDMEFVDGVAIYPNPVLNSVYIDLNKTTGNGTSSYELINLQGEQVLSGDIHAGSLNLDMTSLPEGIYFIRILNESGMVVRKIIKQ